MEDESHGDAAAGEVPAMRKTHRKKLPAPKLSAMIPFALGCAAPIPILMAAMDKVPGEGRPPKTPVLYEFNVLFKLCGALFPVILLVLRMLIKKVFGATSPRAASDLFSLSTCVVVSVMRVVMYHITLLLKDADEEKRDVMSDHVFLAMSIVCLARFELYCCLETLESNKLLALPALLALVLIVLMHCNNYITTRYFHTSEESVMSLVCGGLLFEIPGSIFFYLTRRR